MLFYRLARRCIVATCMLTTISAAASKTFDGYTFVAVNKKAILYDMDSTVVHTWNCPNNITGWADLLRDSSILVPSAGDAKPEGLLRSIPLAGGRIQIINWDGEVTWDYTYSSSEYIPHHDGEPIYRTNDPKEKPTVMLVCATAWGDKLVEIRPTGKTTGEIIWEWKASDHTCQSDCIDKSALLDTSKGGTEGGGFNNTSDVMHTNNVSYNRTLDQLVLSLKGYYEMIIIDHSTTTEQAKGSTGGRYGKGGDILYRWGNPANYGVSGSVQFKGQHHCCWVPDTMPGTNLVIPGAGNFLAVDNDNRRVIEIENPAKTSGVYQRNYSQAFGPASPLWSYKPSSLAGNEGSIQKMPNGNYIICTGGISMGSFGKTKLGSRGSNIYEVDAAGTVLWKLSGFGTSCEGYRYAYGYLGGVTPVKKPAPVAKPEPVIISRTSRGRVKIRLINFNAAARLSLYTLNGRAIVTSVPVGSDGWNLESSISGGMYLVKISSGTSVVWDHLAINR
jgi:hypothetical protein